MILVFDKGHIGIGSDCGAVGNGLYESNLTDTIVNKCVEKLNNYIIDVKVAPRGSLSQRADYANKVKADYFVSIHINSSDKKSATGWESFIYNNASQKSEEYQKIIHTEIMGYLKQFNIVDRKMKRANFAVLRETDMSAILLENLFISNSEDAKLLKDDNFLDGLSDAIVKGLVKCLNLQSKQPKDIKPAPKQKDYIGHQFEKSIEFVKSKGLMFGYSEYEFKPDQPLTRGEFCAVLKRLLDNLQK